jgi:hypothetical protein
MRKCYGDKHSYRYRKYDTGHEFLWCDRCELIFVDTENKLTYQERRDLTVGVFGCIVGLPILWAYIWLYWIAFS